MSSVYGGEHLLRLFGSSPVRSRPLRSFD
jgi:hypothetical protein